MQVASLVPLALFMRHVHDVDFVEEERNSRAEAGQALQKGGNTALAAACKRERTSGVSRWQHHTHRSFSLTSMPALAAAAQISSSGVQSLGDLYSWYAAIREGDSAATEAHSERSSEVFPTPLTPHRSLQRLARPFSAIHTLFSKRSTASSVQGRSEMCSASQSEGRLSVCSSASCITLRNADGVAVAIACA